MELAIESWGNGLFVSASPESGPVLFFQGDDASRFLLEVELCESDAELRAVWSEYADGLAGVAQKGPKMIQEFNLERTEEFQSLTANKAWTVADVRRILPDVPCIAPDNAGRMVARTGRVLGRKNDFATVTVYNDGMPDYTYEFSWATIAAALNNNRALRF